MSWLVSIEDLKKDRNECRTELEKSRAALQNAFIRQNTARLNIEAAQEKKDQTKAGVEDLKKEEIEIETQVLQIRKKRKRQSRSWNVPRLWRARKTNRSRALRRIWKRRAGRKLRRPLY